MAYDPHVKLDFVEKILIKLLKGFTGTYSADHSEFKTFSDDDFKYMKHKIIFDTKTLLNPTLKMYHI